MDFLKKAQKKMKELLDDDEKMPQASTGHQGQYGNQPQYHQQQGFYGGPPPPGPNQHGANGPPQLPPGWTTQWDHNSNRSYYVEQATGRTQWDFPSHTAGGQYASSPYGGPPQDRGMFGGQSNTGYAPQGTYGHDQHKDKGHGGALVAGAGGLAVGAIGGAMIANEMSEDSDAEHRNGVGGYAPPGGYSGQQGDPYAAQMPPPPPEETGDGSSMSSSDKEEIEERREELQEAQEEYNEAVEEGYDD